MFVDLHKKGLIYRDKRLVNWDPKLKTAISDLEVETHEMQGGFWHFQYPLADGVTLDDGRDYIEVATTRPETMLADMAVAVNAADARYQSVIGKFVTLPLTGRRVPIVADDHADPELGSGAVKITPGHDFNDFDVGKRAGFKAGEMLNMLDGDANVIQTADGLIPAEYLGLHRFKRDGTDGARELVVARMKEAGFLIPHTDKDGAEHDAEPRTIQTPFGDRGGVVIEPWLTDQWYVDAETLAQPPMAAVRDGRINIVPKTWEKTFFNWMENIQPWCVSRQLWWGHRIPAWYGPTAEKVRAKNPDLDPVPACFVGNDEDEIRAQALEYYKANGCDIHKIEFFDPAKPQAMWISSEDEIPFFNPQTVNLYRDPDVLDTWFSSALWPFATLGWPEDTDLVKRHYPNDVLISGFDILFFWDARMAMQGMEFMGDVPWKTLYLHGLVRAPDGAKMSKSKGNVVDPLGLIDQYGADALRFFMAAMESQGRDIKMDERRVEGYRNFATKLWNAARFCEANGISASTTLAAPAATLPVNRWIIGEVVATVAAMDKAFADYRFDEAANTIYSFAWDRFCDWYLELIKPASSEVERGAIDDETKAVAGWVLDQILVMLHPFMPFITEELWTGRGDRADYPLITAKWPAPETATDEAAQLDIELVIEAVKKVRAARSEMNIPPGTRIESHVIGGSDASWARLKANWASISTLARIDDTAKSLPADQLGKSNTLQVTVADMTLALQLDGVIDVAAERERLNKAFLAVVKERDSLAARLNNPSFIERAKPEAIDKARADHDDKSAEVNRLNIALARLG